MICACAGKAAEETIGFAVTRLLPTAGPLLAQGRHVQLASGGLSRTLRHPQTDAAAGRCVSRRTVPLTGVLPGAPYPPTRPPSLLALLCFIEYVEGRPTFLLGRPDSNTLDYPVLVSTRSTSKNFASVEAFSVWRRRVMAMLPRRMSWELRSVCRSLHAARWRPCCRTCRPAALQPGTDDRADGCQGASS